MKLIIDIPEESYKAIKAGLINHVIQNIWFDSVLNGTPLPKGHGRLIDADKTIQVYEEIFNASKIKDYVYQIIANGTPDNKLTDALLTVFHFLDELDNAQTIIEADKESDECCDDCEVTVRIGED